MPESLLKTFQTTFPASTSRIAGADWNWRDTDRGSGRLPLIFLPGAGGTGDVFYRAAHAIGDARRVITATYPALIDVGSITAGLAALVAEIGAKEVDIASSSLGGYVAQAFAIEHPSLVRRVLFGNTFFDASWLQAKISRDALLATPPEEHLARTLTQLRALPEDNAHQVDFKSTMLALVGSEQSAEMARASLAAVLSATPLRPVDLPADAIAILDTEDDTVVDVATRSAMRDRYGESARYTFETGGHYPSLLNPGAYAEAIGAHFGNE